MAQYTQEDVNMIRDKFKEKYDYDNMSDEQKARFDKTFDAEIDNYREQGIVEPKNEDPNDTAEDADGDAGDMHNGMQRERGREEGGTDESDKKEEIDPVKERENQEMEAEISKNQEYLDAERQQETEEVETKERDCGGRSL